MKKLLTKISLAGVAAFLQISTVFAEEEKMVRIVPKPKTLPGPTEDTQLDPDGLKSFFEANVFGNLTQTIIAITGTLALLFAIISGVRMVMGFGNEEAYTSAKKGFFLSLAGFGISLLAYTLVSIISNLRF